jgi:hypothetical protein
VVLTAVLLNTKVFRHMTPWRKGSQRHRFQAPMNPIIPEDGGILIRRNVGNHLRHAMTSHPRRLESREIPNGKPL